MAVKRHNLTEITTAFRELENTPGADLAEVRFQHRLLAYVWDPDRLPEHLRERAAQKLARVDHALDVLSDHLRQQHDEEAETSRHMAVEDRRATAKPDGAVRGDVAASAISHALKRVLTEGGRGNFVIVDADASRNYYAQFVTELGSRRIYGEVVGNKNLKREHHLGRSAIRHLEELGWTLDRRGGNFYKVWHRRPADNRERWTHRIAEEAADVLRYVYGITLSAMPPIRINLE